MLKHVSSILHEKLNLEPPGIQKIYFFLVLFLCLLLTYYLISIIFFPFCSFCPMKIMCLNFFREMQSMLKRYHKKYQVICTTREQNCQAEKLQLIFHFWIFFICSLMFSLSWALCCDTVYMLHLSFSMSTLNINNDIMICNINRTFNLIESLLICVAVETNLIRPWKLKF